MSPSCSRWLTDRVSLSAGLGFVVLLGAASAGAGAERVPLGDGSAVSNPDLLRGPLDACAQCMAAAPYEWDAPWFDLDWSLALRGAYVSDNDGQSFEALTIPAVTLRHESMRGGFGISGSAELVKSTTEDYRVGALRAGIDGAYALDRVTSLRGALDLSVTQDRSGALGTPGGIASQPVVASGSGEVGLSRQFGRFDIAARLEAGRTVYGATTRVDASVTDNSHQNNWTAAAGLRLGFEVTPILTAFIDGSIGYQFYDLPSPSVLAPLDAADYQVRAGLAANWHEVLEAEASVGLGLRRFAEPGLGEVTSTLYDASLTYRPNGTTTLSAGLSTTVGAPGAGSEGLARIEHAARADASYRINTWLNLRAMAGWRQAELVGTTSTESGYDLGAGMDYLLNEHATLTADYVYSYAETTPNPGEDGHRVTLGVTFSR